MQPVMPIHSCLVSLVYILLLKSGFHEISDVSYKLFYKMTLLEK